MLEAQATLIESKIDLLEQKYSQALDKIYQAKQIAEQYDLTKLEFQITREYDAMIEQIKLWKNQTNDIEVHERLEEMKFNELFGKLSTDKYKDELIKPEEPIALLILDNSGKLRYSKKFSDKIDINGNLISSFLSAINIFSQDLFQTDHSIDRIKHGDYVIMLKSYDAYSICYIFHGDSYLAEKRVEKFAFALTDHKIIQEIILVSDLNPSHKDMPDLVELINELFSDLII